MLLLLHYKIGASIDWLLGNCCSTSSGTYRRCIQQTHLCSCINPRAVRRLRHCHWQFRDFMPPVDRLLIKKDSQGRSHRLRCREAVSHEQSISGLSTPSKAARKQATTLCHSDLAPLMKLDFSFRLPDFSMFCHPDFPLLSRLGFSLSR